MMTKFGPVDLLGVIGKGRSFASLVPESHELRVGQSSVRVLDLAPLISIKEETARDKDRAVLAILKRTLEEQSK